MNILLVVSISKEEDRIKILFPEADFVLINPVYESYSDKPHLKNLREYQFYPCSYLWQRLTVYSDGTVTTCSRDYDSKYNKIGNVNSNSIYELWHSERLRDMRAAHLNGRRKEFHICSMCENYLIHRRTGLAGSGCTGIVYDMQERM
jgi:radical SAM protein with 4Fe4S-binding SPASM domain